MEVVAWIGYQIDWKGSSLGISASRAQWLCRWITDRIASGSADLRDLHAVLGRLGFSLGALEYLKPSVSPSTRGPRQ